MYWQNGYVGYIYMIRKYMILRTFFYPQIWLAEENPLFPWLAQVPISNFLSLYFLDKIIEKQAGAELGKAQDS